MLVILSRMNKWHHLYKRFFSLLKSSNTNLTEDLIREGIVRELISKVQQLRKTRDYNVIDRINLYYDSDAEVDKCVEEFKDYIMKETLSKDIVKESGLVEEIDLNGHKCFIDIKR